MNLTNTTVIVNNTAGSYGDSISYFASNYTFNFENTSTFMVNETVSVSDSNMTYNKSLYMVPSGQPIHLNISIVDKFGNVLTNEFQPVSYI